MIQFNIGGSKIIQKSCYNTLGKKDKAPNEDGGRENEGAESDW